MFEFLNILQLKYCKTNLPQNWDVSKDFVMAVSTQLVTHIADMRVQHSLDTLKEGVSQIPQLQKRSSASVRTFIYLMLFNGQSDTL